MPFRSSISNMHVLDAIRAEHILQGRDIRLNRFFDDRREREVVEQEVDT